MTDGKLND